MAHDCLAKASYTVLIFLKRVSASCLALHAAKQLAASGWLRHGATASIDAMASLCLAPYQRIDSSVHGDGQRERRNESERVVGDRVRQAVSSDQGPAARSCALGDVFGLG